jgi:hypothetical protein
MAPRTLCIERLRLTSPSKPQKARCASRYSAINVPTWFTPVKAAVTAAAIGPNLASPPERRFVSPRERVRDRTLVLARP